MLNTDNNRIRLSSCRVFNKVRLSDRSLLTPINRADVPMYSTTELKSVTVNPASPRNKENLVDVAEYGIKYIAYYKQEAANNPTYNSNINGAPDVIYAREGVCKQLQKVNEKLSPLGLEIIVYDAHRSPATQRKLYMHFLRVAHEKGLNGDKAEEYAAQYCSNPEGFDKDNPKTWTMHSTGAAVDVYLFDKESGKVVDMGEQYFDNPNPVTHTLYYEDALQNKSLTSEEKDALLARRILFNAMKEGGFYNYGSELFHYEYKGLIYAKVQSEKGIPTAAEYGYLPSPADLQKGLIISSLMASKTK